MEFVKNDRKKKHLLASTYVTGGVLPMCSTPRPVDACSGRHQPDMAFQSALGVFDFAALFLQLPLICGAPG